MKHTNIILALLVLMALVGPVLAAEHKFNTWDIIQRNPAPFNNAYWKVMEYNSVLDAYILEVVTRCVDNPYWVPIRQRLTTLPRRFIDRFFVKAGRYGTNG